MTWLRRLLGRDPNELIGPAPCCPTHADWATLRRHLAVQFPSVHDDQVHGVINDAWDAAAKLGLPDDAQLPTTEMVARHHLALIAQRKRRRRLSRTDPLDLPRTQRNPPTSGWR